MFLLYRALGNEYTKTIKASAVAFGGEVDFDDDWYDPEPPKPVEPVKIFDLPQIPIGLGYETVQ